MCEFANSVDLIVVENSWFFNLDNNGLVKRIIQQSKEFKNINSSFFDASIFFLLSNRLLGQQIGSNGVMHLWFAVTFIIKWAKSLYHTSEHCQYPFEIPDSNGTNKKFTDVLQVIIYNPFFHWIDVINRCEANGKFILHTNQIIPKCLIMSTAN